jgi:hypothetical protein
MTATTTTTQENETRVNVGKIKQMFNLTKNTLMEFKGLTELEFEFIYELSASDFAFECGKEDGIGGYVNSNEGFDMRRVRGVMSSLVQKGYIRVDDMSFIEFGSSSVTKDTWVVVTDMEITETIYALWYPETTLTEVA